MIILKILIITGNHPRHKFLVKEIADLGLDIAWVMEERESFVPIPDSSLDSALADLYRHHFLQREKIEKLYFGQATSFDSNSRGIPSLTVDRHGLNSGAVYDFIRRFKPELVLSYGCHMLGENILDIPETVKWNIHGGLSPYYRGVATHFWPSYLLEPQFTGLTLHVTTPVVDGGNLILQTAVDLNRHHGLHENACDAVLGFSKALLDSLTTLKRSFGEIKGTPQRSAGKLFLASAWKPQHLKLIYETYGDRINDYCLDNGLVERQPRLHNAFLTKDGLH